MTNLFQKFIQYKKNFFNGRGESQTIQLCDPFPFAAPPLKFIRLTLSNIALSAAAASVELLYHFFYYLNIFPFQPARKASCCWCRFPDAPQFGDLWGLLIFCLCDSPRVVRSGFGDPQIKIIFKISNFILFWIFLCKRLACLLQTKLFIT